jgi:integrase
MSVYKKRKGNNANYVFEYTDHLGQRRIKTGTTDKEETRDIGAEIRKKVRLQKAGLIDPAEERFAEERRRPLKQHLEDYEKALRATSCSEKHVKLTLKRVRTIVQGCRFDSLTHLDAPATQRFLDRYVQEHGLGSKTFNHYVQAAVAFGNWLKEAGKIRSNPFENVQRRKAGTDVRRKRRSITPEEMGRLWMSAIESEVRVQGYDGVQRYRAYLLSYLTGLRQNEVAHLQPECFDMESDPPMLSLAAKYTKNGEEVLLPMHPQLVELMAEWLPQLIPGEPLLPGFARKKAWLMVKKDLERIGVAYETNDGTADYHAIGRCSYITQLLVNGVPIHQAMKLARHNSIEMTQRYAKVRQDEAVAALRKLPSAPIPGQRKSQWLKGKESPAESRPVPKTAPRARGVKSSRVGRSVPQRARESGGGDLRRTPPKSGGGGNRTRGPWALTIFPAKELRSRP